MDNDCIPLLYAGRTDLDELYQTFVEYHGCLSENHSRTKRRQESVGYLGLRHPVFCEWRIQEITMRRHGQGEATTSEIWPEAQAHYGRRSSKGWQEAQEDWRH